MVRNRAKGIERIGTRIGKISLHLILILGALVMFFPFLWMFLSTFKPVSEITRIPPTFLPHDFTLENLRKVLFIEYSFGRYFLNSAIVAGTTTSCVLLTSSLAGYIFAKFDFPGKNVLYMGILATMMVPIHVTAIPLFLIMRNLGWINTYWALTVPFTVSAFGIFLFRQYLYGIPRDYFDAARVDGLSELKIYLYIVLPLTKSALSALAIFQFLYQWGLLYWPLIVINSERRWTLPLGIAALRWTGAGSQINLQIAAATVAILPVFLVFLVAQKQFVKGIALTGLKA